MSDLEDSATITASSEYNGNYSKDKCVDNIDGTEWASAGDGINTWIQFTWASPVTIAEIQIRHRNSDPWGWLRFTFSDNSHIDAWDISANAGSYTHVLRHPKTTTSLRIHSIGGIGGDPNPGLAEISIKDTYTTPIADTDLTLPDTMQASSSYNSNYRSRLIFDGNATTEWACNGDGSGAWIEWHWSAPVIVEKIELRDRTGSERWGIPRITFDDASYQDGGEAVSNTAFTTYNLMPKTTTSLRISVASGSSGPNIGLAEAIITGNIDTGGGGNPTVWVSGTVAQVI